MYSKLKVTTILNYKQTGMESFQSYPQQVLSY
jgi:hypothetical protein